MHKTFALTGLAVVLSGCASRAPAWTGTVAWPTEDSARLVGQPMEAGAVLAAAGAVREMVKTNPFPDLFQGCASPEQGLDVTVFTGPTPGIYYVLLHQRFNRCGGPAVRVLDGWYSYAVTPQGEVIAEAPLPDDPSPEAAPQPPAPAPVPTTPPPSPSPGTQPSSTPSPTASDVTPTSTSAEPSADAPHPPNP